MLSIIYSGKMLCFLCFTSLSGSCSVMHHRQKTRNNGRDLVQSSLVHGAGGEAVALIKMIHTRPVNIEVYIMFIGSKLHLITQQPGASGRHQGILTIDRAAGVEASPRN